MDEVKVSIRVRKSGFWNEVLSLIGWNKVYRDDIIVEVEGDEDLHDVYHGVVGGVNNE